MFLGGECRRMEAMSTSSYLQPTTFAVDSDWLTSTPDCQSFDDHFTSKLKTFSLMYFKKHSTTLRHSGYLSYPDSPSLQFTCPGSESILNNTNSSVTAGK